MTQTFNKGKVVLDTIAQFQTLSTTGTLVIGGVTITYDPNHYDYWVKESDEYTKSEINSLLGGKVDKTTTIAGNALSGDISAQTLTDTLIFMNNTTDINDVMED